MSFRALATAALALLSGCGETVPPETLVENLRVLGVTSEPAELRPGETALMEALVRDPSRPGKPNTIFWVGCDPDPFNLGRSACSDPEVLADPSKLAGRADGGMLPEGVKLIGIGPKAGYPTDAQLFRNLPAGDPGRVSGTVGQALIIAAAEPLSPSPTEEEIRALFGRVQSGQVQSRITLFRVKISESPVRNLNPRVAQLKVSGQVQAKGAAILLFPDEKAPVEVVAAESDFEKFNQTSPNGMVEAKTENLVVAWYSTAGRFSQPRIALKTSVENVFSAPGPAQEVDVKVPENRRGTLFTVLRDSRGGQSWAEFGLFFCERQAAGPKVTVASAPLAPGEPVVLEGTDLGNLVDVVLAGVPGGDVALEKGAFNSATQKWEGLVPVGVPAGTYQLDLRGRGCQRTRVAAPLVLP
jgi:hypothetical protein